MADWAFDERLRSAALAYVRAQQLRTAGPVSFGDVADFEFEGRRVPLLDRQRGIRKPALLDAALSFRTVHADRPDRRPYDDAPGPDGYLRYKYRGTDLDHAENRAMRAALTAGLPLIWFWGIAPGWYLPIAPVWLVDEEPGDHQFVVALDAQQLDAWRETDSSERLVLREYSERVVRARVHQPIFRERVLTAYEARCAVCNLGFRELLDAAHVKGDAEGGEPIVPNGIAMCKIHHGAFDASILGVSPDYEIRIRDDVLSQEDGPTLTYALQGVHRRSLQLPAKRAARPNKDLLAERFDLFLAAAS